MALKSPYKKFKNSLHLVIKWMPVSLFLFWILIWFYSVVAERAHISFDLLYRIESFSLKVETGLIKVETWTSTHDDWEIWKDYDWMKNFDPYGRWGLSDLNLDRLNDWGREYGDTGWGDYSADGIYIDDSIIFRFDHLPFYGRILRLDFKPEIELDYHEGSVYVNLEIPFWILTTVFGITLVVQCLLFSPPWKRRFKPYQCQACGYDLSGNSDTTQCPECGQEK